MCNFTKLLLDKNTLLKHFIVTNLRLGGYNSKIEADILLTKPVILEK